MFEDKHMFKFICALLGFASIIIPGPIVPIVGIVIAIAMLVYKIKAAKESPEGFESLMLDIVLIIIVLVVNIGFFAMRISIENDYNKYSSNSSEYSTSDLAEIIITSYKIENSSQFGSGANINKIKNGFKTYLQNELGITDITIKGNLVTCYIRTDQVIFTITSNDIKYDIK